MKLAYHTLRISFQYLPFVKCEMYPPSILVISNVMVKPCQKSVKANHTFFKFRSWSPDPL